MPAVVRTRHRRIRHDTGMRVFRRQPRCGAAPLGAPSTAATKRLVAGWDTALVSDTGADNGGPIPGTGYALRPVAVASDLRALRGTLSGRHQLPLHLDASARAVYDFADPDDREHAYQLVMLEAVLRHPCLL